MVLRMFEELGMPILHIGKCEDCSMSYFWETIPTKAYFSSCTDEQTNVTDFADCNDTPLYPVDVWLYDHRTRATINNEDFAVVFPDQAVLNGQYVEWVIGGGKITPSHAVEILKDVGPAVAGFSRLHDETLCISDLDVTSKEYRQSGSDVRGAGAGEYSCYNSEYHNTKYFQGCEFGGDDAELQTDTNPGACYDVGIHQCSCQPGRCSPELCAANDGIWTAECTDHCMECGSDAVDPAPPPADDTDANKPPVTTSVGDMSAEDEGISASATVLHVSTFAISVCTFIIAGCI